MFRVLDPDILLQLRLKGHQGGDHAGSTFRIVKWSAGGDHTHPVLTIVDEQSGQTNVMVPGRAASRDFTVLLCDEEAARLGNTLVDLKEYPSRVCSLLLKGWPPANEQHLIMAALLEPSAAVGSPWFADACHWTRLNSLRESTPLDQSADEFFSELRRGLNEDRRSWSGAPQPPRPPGLPLRIVRRAKPASFLVEIRKAHAAAQSAAAASPEGKGSLIPYLETALKDHWMTVLREGTILQKIFITASSEELAVEVSIASTGQGNSAQISKVEFRAGGDGETDFVVRLPFDARPDFTDEPQRYEARLTVSAPPHGRQVRRPAGACRRQLQFHLNDLAWALDRHFAKHAVTVRATERLFFRDVEHFQNWMGKTAQNREARLRLLAGSWRKAGPPMIGKDSAEGYLQELGKRLLRQP